MPNKTISTPNPKMQVPDVSPKWKTRDLDVYMCARLLFSVSPKYKDPNKYKAFHPAIFLFLATVYPAHNYIHRCSMVLSILPVCFRQDHQVLHVRLSRNEREAFEDFLQPLALHSSLTPVYD
jgi:hypothetical protein